MRLGYPPPELLTLQEAHMCVRSRLALRTQQIAFSDQNQVIKSATFTPSQRTHNITGYLAGTGVEAWLEQKLGASDLYKLVEVVNLAELERQHSEGRRVCAFHGNEHGQRFVTFGFTIDGQSQFRLWFDPHSETDAGNNATSQLPGDLNILVELEAGVDAIDKIIMRLTRRLEAEEERQLINAQVGGWQNLKAGFLMQIPLWERQYQTWLHRSRGSQVSGNLPRKIKRGLFI
jgi:hypothetical protein